MFTNPLDSALFLPTVYRLVALLGGVLIILLFLSKGNVKNLVRDSLFQRWRVWVVISPIFLISVLSGEVTTTVFITAITVQGLREYATLVDLPQGYRRVLLFSGLIVTPIASLSINGFYLLAPVLLILATLQPLVFSDVKNGVRQLAFAALGWGYIGWFLGHFVLISNNLPGGDGILLALGLSVAFSDVGAFTVGKALGRHKMAPRLSPNKTWEGAAGNLIGAYVAVAIMGFALPSNLFWIITLALPLLVAPGAVWGDLFESAIKREFEVKDADNWLPGFGGILDRIDSLILVTPLVYYSLLLLNKVV